MDKRDNSQLVEQLKSNISSIRFAFIGLFIVAIVLGVPVLIVIPAFNLLMAFTMAPFFLLLLVSSILGLTNGRAVWWFLSAINFFSLLTLVSICAFIIFSGINDFYLILALLVSLFVVSIFSWRWGAERFNTETMEYVLAAKRIDVEKGTYSPFTFPLGILKTKSSKKWFVLANASGPLIISLTLILGHWLGKYNPNAGNLWTAICGYAGVVICVYAIAAGLDEYAWIRRWEKETGRKMYLSYVVDWRRYKEQEKARKQAEQSKLRSLRN